MLVNKQCSGFHPGGLPPLVNDVLDGALAIFGLQTQHGHMPAITVFVIFSLSWVELGLILMKTWAKVWVKWRVRIKSQNGCTFTS